MVELSSVKADEPPQHLGSERCSYELPKHCWPWYVMEVAPCVSQLDCQGSAGKRAGVNTQQPRGLSLSVSRARVCGYRERGSECCSYEFT